MNETSHIIYSKNRIIKYDLIKGIMIYLVVIGHSGTDVVHDIIFLFHMPLFFALSGVFLQKEKLITNGYVLNRAIKLLVPYCCYLFMDFTLIQRNYLIGSFVRLFYGGRSLHGVYWYITCFIFTLILFAFLLKRFSEKAVKCLILIGGGIAIIESHLGEKISILQSPGMPWNVDVSLMALVYVGIGYFYKKEIEELIDSDATKYDVVGWGLVILLGLFCFFNYAGDKTLYYFDMKLVYYKELCSAILIPCAFGYVVVRIVHWLIKIEYLKVVQNFLAFCGRATIPIMFMHMPLNHWKNTIGYGRIAYVVIGVGIPLMITLIFNQVKIIKKSFGLPDLVGK